MKPRIYAACLASYNNGTLHGCWIDADQEPEGIQDAINAMLRESKYPNVIYHDNTCDECGHEWRTEGHANPRIRCPKCESDNVSEGEGYPSAEEWAIHDYESMPDLGEYPSIEEISKHGLAVAEHGDAWLAWCEICDKDEEDEESFQDAYQGKHDSLKDYVESMVEDVYGELLKAMDKFTWCGVSMSSYLDVEQMAHDLQCAGGVVIQRGHVFEVG